MAFYFNILFLSQRKWVHSQMHQWNTPKEAKIITSRLKCWKIPETGSSSHTAAVGWRCWFVPRHGVPRSLPGRPPGVRVSESRCPFPPRALSRGFSSGPNPSQEGGSGAWGTQRHGLARYKAEGKWARQNRKAELSKSPASSCRRAEQRRRQPPSQRPNAEMRSNHPRQEEESACAWPDFYFIKNKPQTKCSFSIFQEDFHYKFSI